jgi:hypothetical protein
MLLFHRHVAGMLLSRGAQNAGAIELARCWYAAALA